MSSASGVATSVSTVEKFSQLSRSSGTSDSVSRCLTPATGGEAENGIGGGRIHPCSRIINSVTRTITKIIFMTIRCQAVIGSAPGPGWCEISWSLLSLNIIGLVVRGGLSKDLRRSQDLKLSLLILEIPAVPCSIWFSCQE